MAAAITTLVTKLIDISPVLGCCLIFTFAYIKVYNRYIEDIKQTYDKSLVEIRETYKQNQEQTRETLKIMQNIISGQNQEEKAS